jgi:predicted GTPase
VIGSNREGYLFNELRAKMGLWNLPIEIDFKQWALQMMEAFYQGSYIAKL